jgi:stage IV sporulation protein FB
MKIKVLFITQVYLLVCLLSGYWYEVMYLYLCLLVHEIGHIVVIKLFRKKISKLEISPLGGILSIEDCQNDFNYKEMLIYLGGPIASLILYIYLLFTSSNDILITSASYILILNLLPILPLDGAKILMSSLQTFLPYKKVIKYSCMLSMISCIILIVFFIHNYFYVFTLVFFMYKNFLFYYDIPYEYHGFLMYKSLHHNRKLNKKLNLHEDPINAFYKGYNNVFYSSRAFVDEVEVLKNMLNENYC